jgi:AcrR family transcriptional regulator
MKTERPKRGAPTETRRRLVEAAAEDFNAHGLHETTAGRIAERAGYATGTFYKHFRSKNEALVAAYEAWVSAEWDAVGREVLAGGDPEGMARRIVALGVELHVRWSGLRRAMFTLVASDASAQRSYRNLQRRQLKIVEALRKRRGEHGRRSREADALVLMTMERVFDGIAEGELRELRLSRTTLLEHVVSLLTSVLQPIEK